MCSSRCNVTPVCAGGQWSQGPGNTFTCGGAVTVAPAGGSGLTPEENLRLNERALQNYRDGWEIGDSDMILKYSPESFTFTWENNQV